MDAYRQITEVLTPEYGLSEARAMAFWMLEEWGYSRTDVLCGKVGEIGDLSPILARVLQHEPLPYIFGHTMWNGMDLRVNASTLIPRPETAELIALLPPSRSILDIGTGSGCIAIAAACRFPEAEVTAWDISAEALVMAKENARLNRAKVHFEQVDILSEQVPEALYDTVVSNPPYITQLEKVDMSANVLDYEPHSALFVPDEDPLLFYRRIAELRLGRNLYFEINERFGHETAQMLRSLGYVDVQIYQDMYGKDRFVSGRML